MIGELSNEIISAEIVFSSKSNLSAIPLSDDYYRQELSVINDKLQKYTNHADRYDYMVAVASGILCGVLDAQVAGITKKVLNSSELDLQGKGKEFVKTLSADLEKDRGKTSIAGLSASVFSTCINKKTKGLFTKNKKTNKDEFDTSKAMELFGGAVISALLKWFAVNRKPAEIDESDFPEPIKKLLHQVNEHPKVRDFLKDPKIPDIDPQKLKELGVPVIFLSMFEPELNDANKILNKAKKVPGNTIRKGLSKLPKIEIDVNLLGNLADQAVSVLANEIIVRCFYFLRNLMIETERTGDFEEVDWSKVIPFDNKTITRMLTVSSLTFTAADMSIAAVRAAVESGGHTAVFASKYFTNINVIGVGRAIIAVTRDVSMEWQETDLIRERRDLTERISAEQVDAILAYRKQMETIVEEYLAEDLREFLTGTAEIEEGLETNDSDQVIHGNVTIQRILGREPQFTNQAEFDDLMNSIDALVL